MGKLAIKLAAVAIGLWAILAVMGCDTIVNEEPCAEVKVSGEWKCVD